MLNEPPEAFAAASADNSSAVLALLRRMVDSGETGPDGRLPTERELGERLGVGRRAVRRALEALEAEGLVWRRQGKGTFVGQPPDPASTLAAELVAETDPAAVMEARLAIEPALARLSAERAQLADIVRMRHLATRTAGTRDSDGAELWDGALHRLIARTAQNRILLTSFGLLDAVRGAPVWQEVRARTRTAESVARYHSQHGAIIDAIAAHDGDAAEAAMRAHLLTLLESLNTVLARGGTA